ncbi:LysR substrate-binding domain-containing protein [Rhizobium sp. CG5]|uniref:LysR substrate-binding domain-containing protein n=1 Tax=Rhizobium sp. CG5 TaxID=2726076 RepID=UPI002033EAAD|nr:LysR substrate-binding domain-containing protein [Rhizobium sp. CG5]
MLEQTGCPCHEISCRHGKTPGLVIRRHRLGGVSCSSIPMVTLAPMIMPELSHAFTSAFPSTKVMQVVSDHDTLLHKLANAEIDVAIGYDLQVPEGFDFIPLASLPPHVLVGEIHPFARLSAVSIKDIAPEPLLLLDLPISSEYFLAIFMQEGLTPHIAAHAA